jgi:tetratricopeptide (TPR) repeat protein
MYKDKGDLATARRHYELSLRGKPRFHMAEYHIATILAGEGKYEEALERLRIADEDAHLYNQKHRYAMIATEIERVKQLMARRGAEARPK